MQIKGKVWVVTGAASGIGRELSRQLVQMGAHVALVDSNQLGLVETAQMLGERNVSLHLLDLANKVSIRNLPKEVIEQHGVVDGIINNAAVPQHFVHLEFLSSEDIERILNVNCYSVIAMCKAFLPELQKRPEAHIVNVSSLSGLLAVVRQSVYAAAKAAVKNFTEALREEQRYGSVQVTGIYPGIINTDFMPATLASLKNYGLEPAENPLDRIQAMEVEVAVKEMIKGIEKNKGRLCIGSDAKIFDLLYRLHPRLAVKTVARKFNMILKTSPDLELELANKL